MKRGRPKKDAVKKVDNKLIARNKSDSSALKRNRPPQENQQHEEEDDCLTPDKKRLRSSSTDSPNAQSPPSWRSPRRCSAAGDTTKSPIKVCNGTVTCLPKSPRKKLLPLLYDHQPHKPKWNPRDPSQIKAVKESLHVSTSPFSMVCREQEQKRILDFCKKCIESDKSGSLYVSGCPGTGKTLSIEKVKGLLLTWTKEVGFQAPDILALNCTALAKTSDIFTKIVEKHNPRKKSNGTSSSLQLLQNLFSSVNDSSPREMMLVVIDELDYLITKDGAVLHDLFMLTTFPFSRLILIGIANAIDLADRFLPRLESLSCKPIVVTFCAYSKDQILRILQQRLMDLGYDVFEPLALEFCARKIAAASGDIRRALGACMSALEVFEMECKTHTANQGKDIVCFGHMEKALSRAFKSSTVDTIQSLPHHQQIILCSLMKLLRAKKSFATVGELNRSYFDICRATQVSAAGMLEFSNMCQVLGDQGLLKVGTSRQDKLKRVSLAIDSADIVFALKDNRFFRNCLE